MCRVQTQWEKAVEFHGHECPGLSFELPERARLFTTVICENCGEGAPEQKLRINDGKKVCLDCFKDYSRGW